MTRGNLRGQKRSNEAHASTTDPEARLYRRTLHGDAKLTCLGHIVTENRNGPAIAGCLTNANGYAERAAALEFVEPLRKGKRITFGADRGYDAAAIVAALRKRCVTQNETQNKSGWRSAIDGRTTRHLRYNMSQALRPMIERVPASLKKVAGQASRGTEAKP